MVKKRMEFLVVFSTLIGFGLLSVNIHASSWHWGMPSALQGKWYLPHDKIFHTTMINGKNYSHIYSNDPGFLNNTKYKYLGKHIYEVNGYEPVYSKKRYNTYFKWYNHNKISISNILNKHTDWKMGIYYRK